MAKTPKAEYALLWHDTGSADAGDVREVYRVELYGADDEEEPLDTVLFVSVNALRQWLAQQDPELDVSTEASVLVALLTS